MCAAAASAAITSSRNGSRPRTVTFLDFQAYLRRPRVVCQCGGSVRLNFDGLLRPYQRLGDDVDAQIRRWAQLRLSLREMQAELAHSRVGSLGWRTLNERLPQLRDLTPDLDAHQVPPILQIDASWFTQLQATEELRPDRRGRRRTVKQGRKRPIFSALGIWPDTGRRETLAWQLGASEDAAAWLTFLSDLEAQGLRGANGLRLIIHDGGAGLSAALQTVDFDAAQQRCLFHKLRNIASALQLDPQLTPKQRRRIRAANAYHSDDGVLAMIAQEADQAFRPGRTRLHKPAT